MKRVVIIGGGFAGSTVAMKLQSDFNVTLIDDKDYFEYTPGVLRAIVEPAHANKLQAIHDGYLKKAKVLNCKVDSISANADAVDQIRRVVAKTEKKLLLDAERENL